MDPSPLRPQTTMAIEKVKVAARALEAAAEAAQGMPELDR